MIHSVLAHGGVAGAIAEGAIALAVVGVFAAIWLRERSARRADEAPDSELTGDSE